MAKPESKVECALWYRVEDTEMVGLFESDYESADYAVRLVRTGAGTPIGCEFPDGSTVLIANWAEYADAVQRADEAEEEAQNPPPPTKAIISPFSGEPVVVDRKTPNWVGAPVQPGPSMPGEPMFPITPL